MHDAAVAARDAHHARVMDLEQRIDRTARLRSGSRDGLRNAAVRAGLHVCDHAVGSDEKRVRRRDEGASGVAAHGRRGDVTLGLGEEGVTDELRACVQAVDVKVLRAHRPKVSWLDLRTGAATARLEGPDQAPLHAAHRPARYPPHPARRCAAAPRAGRARSQGRQLLAPAAPALRHCLVPPGAGVPAPRAPAAWSGWRRTSGRRRRRQRPALAGARPRETCASPLPAAASPGSGCSPGGRPRWRGQRRLATRSHRPATVCRHARTSAAGVAAAALPAWPRDAPTAAAET
eukprot:scaffold12080_cov67-Phaeocystis_antarctica.AAC.13